MARAAWCNRGGIGDETCSTEFEASFEAEWYRERAAYLAQLDTPDQAGRDLRRANLHVTFLAYADLSEARLAGADLYRAQLEGANLFGARLEGADLRIADLRQSSWAGASKWASPTYFADFRSAQGLAQAQLEDLIGNSGTLLPEGTAPDTGAPFYVWSCWEAPRPDLDQIVATAAGLIADNQELEALRAEFLCGPGNTRRKTGTPLALDAPYPERHPLAERE